MDGVKEVTAYQAVAGTHKSRLFTYRKSCERWIKKMAVLDAERQFTRSTDIYVHAAYKYLIKRPYASSTYEGVYCEVLDMLLNRWKDGTLEEFLKAADWRD